MRKNYFLICIALFTLGFTHGAFAQAPEIIQTIAGTGTGGYNGDNIAAVTAQLNGNYLMNFDAAGANLYVADVNNNRIRKINISTGIITTVAGNGATGSSGDGGAATAARLSGPVGVALDAAGNIYIADDGNFKIRMVNGSTGIITTIAGVGTPGFSPDGTPATAASISGSRGIAVDAAGTSVFFSDSHLFGSNQRVRLINMSTGLIYTYAGNGTATFAGDGGTAITASINNPRGLSIDPLGNLYIADMTNNRIRKVTPLGIISTVAGSSSTPGFGGDGGAATAAQLNLPADIKLDAAGNMFIADVSNGRVRFVNATTGNISTIAGASATTGYAGDGGLATAAAVRMNQPASIAINPASDNYFYISDRGNNRIRWVKPNSTPYFTGGTRQTITICENSGANSMNTLYAVMDSDKSQTLTWSMVTAPANGALAFGATAISTTSTVTPTGMSYTPTVGYSGLDSFTVQISDGFATSNTKIVVTINPLPVVAAITGASTVCQLASITLSDVTAGGVWSASNGNATVTGGVVTGVTAGTDVISYTVTNSCGPTSSTKTVTINPLPNAGSLTGPSPSNVCVGANILISEVGGDLGGGWTSSNSGIASVDATGTVYGVTVGTVMISYTVTNSCGTAFSTTSVNVITIPGAGVISGPTTVCETASVSLTDASPGGTWATTTGNASVTGTGVVTGVTAGTDVISYTVGNACGSATATYAMTVNPLPNAGTISGPTTVCLAATISLSDPAGGGAGTWTASNTNATVSGGVVTGLTVGTDVISYAVTNVCGTAVATTTVNVISIPSAGTITGATSVCVGANISLTDAVSSGTWTSSNSRATVIPSTGVVTGVTSGLDTIIYTVSYTCGTASTSYPITINPLANPGTISGSSFVCIGSTATFTDAATGVWSITNAHATISTAGVVTGVTAGLDTIMYSATNGCGTVSTSRTVNVNPIVTPSVTVSANPGFTSCAGNPVTYTANPVNGGSAPTYQWSVNGTALATGTGFVHTPANGDIISCTLTSTAACLSVPTATYTATATVKPYLAPSVSISTGGYGDTVCIGTLTPFTPSPVNSGTTPGYQWQVNGTTVPGATTSTFYYTPNNGDIIDVVLTSSYLCPLPTTATSNAITMTVDVTEVPNVNITANPGNSVCTGSLATFSAHPLYGGVPPTFLWTKNGVNVATGPTYTYVPGNGDNVYCVMTSSSTCIAPGFPTTYTSNVITVSTVNPISQTVTINSSTGTVVGVGYNALLTALVTPITATTSYQWYLNGTVVPGATNSTFIINESIAASDLVNCIVNSGDACNESATSNLLTIQFTTGVSSVSAGESSFNLTPNPNSGSFTVTGTLSSGNKDVSLEILDVIGQVVYRGTGAANNGALHQAINMDNGLANGTYMLHITNGDEHKVIRFVVNR
jgi:hypothetical protein